MQSNIVLFVVLRAALLERKAVDAASVIHAIVLAIGLLIEKHIKAVLRVLHAPAHGHLFELALVKHCGIGFAPNLEQILETTS